MTVLVGSNNKNVNVICGRLFSVFMSMPNARNNTS